MSASTNVPASTLISDAGTSSLPGAGDNGEGPGTRQNLTFTVHGTPIPQGSHKGFVVNGRAVVTNDNKKTRPWRQDVVSAALTALALGSEDEQGMAPRQGFPFNTGPVAVHVKFVMPRPKHHYRTGRNAHLLRDSAPEYPTGKPDVDKLCRALLDALTIAGVVKDDAQVVWLDAIKVYATHETPCAQVRVTAA